MLRKSNENTYKISKFLNDCFCLLHQVRSLITETQPNKILQTEAEISARGSERDSSVARIEKKKEKKNANNQLNYPHCLIRQNGNVMFA